MNAAILVNADDFGLSESTTAASHAVFLRHQIDSASLMVNTPAYSLARDLIRKHRLTVGLHLTLTEGHLLTMAAQHLQPRWLNFFRNRFFVFLPLPVAQLAIIHAEFVAQIERAQADGIPLAFLDSHHHVHTNWWIGTVVMRLARQFHISAVRIHANLQRPRYNLLRIVYIRRYNQRLQTYGLARSAYFGSIQQVGSLSLGAGERVEIMVHPDFDVHGNVIDQAGSWTAPLADRLRLLEQIHPADGPVVPGCCRG